MAGEHLNPKALAEAYKEELAGMLGPRLVSVVLFGSAARGEFSPGSDIDLLVVAEGLPASRRDRHRLLLEVEERLEPMVVDLSRGGQVVEFSVLLRSTEEAVKPNPLYLDMVEDSVLIFDRDGFFGKVLQRLKQRLDFYGAQRVRLGKVRYWRLKPDYKWGEVLSFD